MAFIKSDNARYSGTAIEQEPEKVARLSAFAKRVKDSYEVNWFDNPDELSSKVVISLHNEMQRNDRPGWIRSGNSESYDYEENDFDYETAEYEFFPTHIPTDGVHKEVSTEGTPIAEGEWRKNKLVKGVEYDWLIYKPDCPEDPYDSTEDFEYEKLEQYGWNLGILAFQYSESYISDDRLEEYYVVDMQVNGGTEQMFNIRTLEKFLRKKNPERLEYFRGSGR